MSPRVYRWLLGLDWKDIFLHKKQSIREKTLKLGTRIEREERNRGIGSKQGRLPGTDETDRKGKPSKRERGARNSVVWGIGEGETGI